MLWFYLSLSLVSAAGVYLLAHRHFREARSMSQEELLRRLVFSPSVRNDLLERFLKPVGRGFRQALWPALLRRFEKIIIRFRMAVLRLESRLKWLSDNIRGRHINLDTSKKSEYWQNVNGAKNAKNGTEEKLE